MPAVAYGNGYVDPNYRGTDINEPVDRMSGPDMDEFGTIFNRLSGTQLAGNGLYMMMPYHAGGFRIIGPLPIC